MDNRKSCLQYGRRTRTDILRGRNIRQGEDGRDIFEDYWTDSGDDDNMSISSKSSNRASRTNKSKKSAKLSSSSESDIDENINARSLSRQRQVENSTKASPLSKSVNEGGVNSNNENIPAERTINKPKVKHKMTKKLNENNSLTMTLGMSPRKVEQDLDGSARCLNTDYMPSPVGKNSKNTMKNKSDLKNDENLLLSKTNIIEKETLKAVENITSNSQTKLLRSDVSESIAQVNSTTAADSEIMAAANINSRFSRTFNKPRKIRVPDLLSNLDGLVSPIAKLLQQKAMSPEQKNIVSPKQKKTASPKKAIVPRNWNKDLEALHNISTKSIHSSKSGSSASTSIVHVPETSPGEIKTVEKYPVQALNSKEMVDNILSTYDELDKVIMNMMHTNKNGENDQSSLERNESSIREKSVESENVVHSKSNNTFIENKNKECASTRKLVGNFSNNIETLNKSSHTPLDQQNTSVEQNNKNNLVENKPGTKSTNKGFNSLKNIGQTARIKSFSTSPNKSRPGVMTKRNKIKPSKPPQKSYYLNQENVSEDDIDVQSTQVNKQLKDSDISKNTESIENKSKTEMQKTTKDISKTQDLSKPSNKGKQTKTNLPLRSSKKSKVIDEDIGSAVDLDDSKSNNLNTQKDSYKDMSGNMSNSIDEFEKQKSFTNETYQNLIHLAANHSPNSNNTYISDKQTKKYSLRSPERAKVIQREIRYDDGPECYSPRSPKKSNVFDVNSKDTAVIFDDNPHFKSNSINAQQKGPNIAEANSKKQIAEETCSENDGDFNTKSLNIMTDTNDIAEDMLEDVNKVILRHGRKKHSNIDSSKNKDSSAESFKTSGIIDEVGTEVNENDCNTTSLNRMISMNDKSRGKKFMSNDPSRKKVSHKSNSSDLKKQVKHYSLRSPKKSNICEEVNSENEGVVYDDDKVDYDFRSNSVNAQQKGHNITKAKGKKQIFEKASSENDGNIKSSNRMADRDYIAEDMPEAVDKIVSRHGRKIHSNTGPSKNNESSQSSQIARNIGKFSFEDDDNTEGMPEDTDKVVLRSGRKKYSNIASAENEKSSRISPNRNHPLLKKRTKSYSVQSPKKSKIDDGNSADDQYVSKSKRLTRQQKSNNTSKSIPEKLGSGKSKNKIKEFTGKHASSHLTRKNPSLSQKETETHSIMSSVKSRVNHEEVGSENDSYIQQDVNDIHKDTYIEVENISGKRHSTRSVSRNQEMSQISHNKNKSKISKQQMKTTVQGAIEETSSESEAEGYISPIAKKQKRVRDITNLPKNVGKESNKKQKQKEVKAKDKDPISEENIRRSGRQRYAPLDHWRNERLLYRFEGGQIKSLGINKGTDIDSGAFTYLYKAQNKYNNTKEKHKRVKSKRIQIYDNVYEKIINIKLFQKFMSVPWDDPVSLSEDPHYRIKRVFNTKTSAFGFIEIDSFEQKPTQYMPDEDLHMTVMKGHVEVCIQDNKLEAMVNDMFVVPRSTAYSLKNLDRKKALLTFVVGKFKFLECHLK